jgi:integrase
MRDGKGRLRQIGRYWLSRRRNSAAWCRTWFDASTRQTCRASLGTEDLDEAKLALAAWITANAKPERTRPEDAPLETYLVRYLEQHAKYLASAEPTRYGLVRWSEFFAGALVSEITPQRQREFVDSLRSRGLSEGYIRRILAVGQAALNRAYREGEITSVPRILLSLAPEGEPRERLLTIDEARALFAAATERHQMLYLMLAFATAARPTAILELTAFQVDCDARLIRLNPAGRAQNKKRRPTLPICDALLPWLHGLPAGPVVQYRGRALAGTKMLFRHLTNRVSRKIRHKAAAAARTHRRANRRTEAWGAIEEARRRSTEIMEVTAYTIRHTIAAEMRKRGVPVWEVAGFLGHSSGYKTTERYAKFGPDHLAGAVRAIDGYFADLGLAVLPPPATHPLRVSSVLVPPRMGPYPIGKMVEPTGIEPVTSTMPL